MDYSSKDISSDFKANSKQSATPVSETELTDELVIPVVREEVEVHKEVRKTGTVRIRKTVHESEEMIRETLSAETVSVERVPVDRIVDSMPDIRTEGETTIIPVVKEEIVVIKQLRVVEELHITRQQSTSEYKEPVTLYAEEVIIERVSDESEQPVAATQTAAG